jgi:hypothetical protein
MITKRKTKEKYPSKKAMANEGKGPLKQVSALSGKKTPSKVAPKTVAAGAAKRGPILMKKNC